MISAKNLKIYDMDLISKVKKQTGPKKLKKIINNLRNLSKKDVKEFSELKIKVFEAEEKKIEYKISAPLIHLQNYIEDLKKLSLKKNVNNDIDYEGENTPSTVGNEEEINQIDSSDLSDDE